MHVHPKLGPQNFEISQYNGISKGGKGQDKSGITIQYICILCPYLANG